MKDEAIHRALGAAHGEKKPKMHTHRVEYERADNGGFHARVHKRAEDGSGESKMEHHVLPDAQAAQEHLDAHMGDQPPAEAMGPEDEQSEMPPGGDSAGPGAGPAPAAGM